MRPVPVPEEVKAAEWVQAVKVFSAPDGNLAHDQIAPTEGIIFRDSDGAWCAGVVVYLEDADLERINEGSRHFVMAWPGAMPVFLEPWML